MPKRRARREVKNVDYRERLLARLKDPEEAAAYINAAFQEKHMPEVLLIALRDVAEANGISSVARRARINRVSIYKALSKNGNPGIDTLQKILNAVGLKVSVQAA
ncbi:MAG: putative addiction module antidote protein [Acidobacteria bacterium]|nr:putative addiction module antidote protein [Acidobacteriota bacterium]